RRHSGDRARRPTVRESSQRESATGYAWSDHRVAPVFSDGPPLLAARNLARVSVQLRISRGVAAIRRRFAGARADASAVRRTGARRAVAAMNRPLGARRCFASACLALTVLAAAC